MERKDPVGPHITVKTQRSSREIISRELNRVRVAHRLTRNLTQDDISTVKVHQNHSATSHLLAEIGKWKRNDYNLPPHKLRHASSTSGRSQSRANTISLASAPETVTVSLSGSICSRSDKHASTAQSG